LMPVKNRAGNRAYRKRDIEMIQLVKTLLYERKYTIDGARQKLAELRKEGTQLEVELEETRLKDTFQELADHLADVVEYIDAFRRGDARPGEIPERREEGS
ncbi:MAG: MerR family transcriptional regulator, partial [Gemmatimonadota bacterium]